MKKRWKIMIVALCGALLLSGCGKGNGTNSKMGSKDVIEEQEYSLSESFSTNFDAIWYLTENGIMGKDTKVECIYVSSGGKMHRYSVSEDGYKLGDFAQMTDDEIISTLQTAEEEKTQSRIDSFKESVQTDIDRCDALIANLPDTMECEELGFCRISGFENVKAKLQVYRDNLSAALESIDTDGLYNVTNLSYIAYTDATGNMVQEEEIQGTYDYNKYITGNAYFLTYLEEIYQAYQNRLQTPYQDEDDFSTTLRWAINDAIFSSGCEYVEISDGLDGRNWEINIVDWHGITDDSEEAKNAQYTVAREEGDSSIENIQKGVHDVQVYDSYYQGYYCEDGENCLIMRATQYSLFELDSLDTENLIIDPED